MWESRLVPAATANRIEKTGYQSKRNEKGHAQRSLSDLHAPAQERKANEHVGAEDDQDQRDPGPGRVAVEIAQYGRAGERTHTAGRASQRTAFQSVLPSFQCAAPRPPSSRLQPDGR